MKIAEMIVRQAAPYEAVAFDVFDTLLKRDVGKPTDLFLLRGKEFAAARTEAEQQARAAQPGEITLSQIYERPCLAGYDPADECGLELAAAVPNLPVLQAVQELRRQGKRLYYISDMYLPPEQVATMLALCGYGRFDGGFVSCLYGVQKRSGALFRRFLHETGLKAGQVLFVGDSWRADVAGAALAGIHALHLPDPKALGCTPLPHDAVTGAAYAFASNRQQTGKNAAESLGFEVLGPLVISFCKWLHQRRGACTQGRVFFLARDMYLIRAVYALLYPEEETFYLQVSRRSLCPALLAQKDWRLLIQALPRQVLSGAQIAAYCGTSCPAMYARRRYDLKTSQGSEAVRPLLEGLQPPPDGMLALDYLRRSGLRDGDLLVDIGSGGTTQLLLESLCGITLHGLQFSGDERLRQRFTRHRAEVFFHPTDRQATLYWAGQPMLERFLSEDVGATLGYVQQGNGIAVRCAPQQKQPLIAALQRGALQYAQAWRDSVLRDLALPAADAVAPFLQLVGKPAPWQVRLLGSLTVEDGGTYPLAAPAPLAKYLARPGAAKQDFARSRWKIGFLKQLLPWPLPYDRLYLAMKK